MKNLMVWVVEDENMDREPALKIIKEVEAAAKSFTFDVWVSTSLEWGPTGWPSLSKNGAPSRPSRLPDVVILDLFDEGMKGDSFYCRLRGAEKEQQTRSAFVIIWSRYSGITEAEKFIAEATNKDGNVIPLATKSRRLLRERLHALIERIEEEG